MQGNDFTIDDFFVGGDDFLDEIDGVTRRAYIRDGIEPYLSEDEKAGARTRAEKIAELYSDRDMDCLNILNIAAQKGCFEEFAKRLEELYSDKKLYLAKSYNAQGKTRNGAILAMDAVLEELRVELNARDADSNFWEQDL